MNLPLASKCIVATTVLVAALCCAQNARSQTADKAKKVLIIGIDGCRPDALQKAKAPVLAALAEKGAFTYTAHNLPLRIVDAETTSGPGWASMLCGAFPDKHGWIDDVKRQRFNGRIPHFFARLKAHNDKLTTASIITWAPIKKMVTAGDVNEHVMTDQMAEDRLLELIDKKCPDASFIHLDHVDHNGHKRGFNADVPDYLAAIEEIDGRVGRLVGAVRKRPAFDKEDWLFIVSTDHGGWGNGHSSHKNVVPEIRKVFIIVNGDAAQPGKIDGQAYIVDVTATALAHMGVKIDPAWNLDGVPVGLKGFPPPAVSRPNEPAATELIRVKK